MDLRHKASAIKNVYFTKFFNKILCFFIEERLLTTNYCHIITVWGMVAHPTSASTSVEVGHKGFVDTVSPV